MSADYQSVPQNEATKRKVEQMELEEDDGGVGLKPTLGLVQGCTVIVGCIIGSGIFIAPGGVLLGTGSINMALLVWIICGVFSMIGAYCYAELGCMIKKTGGDYTYILDTFGPFVGFIRLWAECIIVRPCTITIVALTFAKYMAKPFFPDCEPPDESVRMLAAICICKSINTHFKKCIWDQKSLVIILNCDYLANRGEMTMLEVQFLIDLHTNFSSFDIHICKWLYPSGLLEPTSLLDLPEPDFDLPWGHIAMKLVVDFFPQKWTSNEIQRVIVSRFISPYMDMVVFSSKCRFFFRLKLHKEHN